MDEEIFTIFMVLVSTALWAYIVVSLTGILSMANKHDVIYETKMQDINDMIRNNEIDPVLADRVRQYWREVQSVKSIKAATELLSELSPGLQSEILFHIGIAQFSALPLFADSDPRFLSMLTRSVVKCIQLYSPMESIVTRPTLDGTSVELVGQSLCICANKGIVAFNGRIYGARGFKNYWHEDFILENSNLRIHLPACALSYSEVQFVPYIAVKRLLLRGFFDGERRKWHKAKVQLAVRRGVVKYAQVLKNLQITESSATIFDVDFSSSEIEVAEILGLSQLTGTVNSHSEKHALLEERVRKLQMQLSEIEELYRSIEGL